MSGKWGLTVLAMYFAFGAFLSFNNDDIFWPCVTCSIICSAAYWIIESIEKGPTK